MTPETIESAPVRRMVVPTIMASAILCGAFIAALAPESPDVRQDWSATIIQAAPQD